MSIKPLRVAFWALLFSFGSLVLLTLPEFRAPESLSISVPDLDDSVGEISPQQSARPLKSKSANSVFLESRPADDSPTSAAAITSSQPTSHESLEKKRSADPAADPSTADERIVHATQQAARTSRTPNDRQPHRERSHQYTAVLESIQSRPEDSGRHRDDRNFAYNNLDSQLTTEKTSSSPVPQIQLGPILDPTDPPTVRSARSNYGPRVTAAVQSQSVDFTESPFEPSNVYTLRETGNSRIDARLAGLERTLDRLALAEEHRNNDEADRTHSMIRDIQQAQELQTLKLQLQQLQSNFVNGLKQTVSPVSQPGNDDSAAKPTSPFNDQPVLKAQPVDESGETFSLQVQDAEVSRVMEMLGELAGLNILVGKDVTGQVTANLQDVTVEEALHAVLKSLGYVYVPEGKFLYIMTPAEATARRRADRKVITKIYRPHYISAKELQALILPLLTPEIGQVAVTNPSETGIPHDAEQAGGDTLSQRDALLVLDYLEVIREIDGVMKQMDVPPMQVVIETMILSVQLNDTLAFGVNFALLNDTSENLIVSGNGQTLNTTPRFPGVGTSIVPPVGQFIANTAGLKYGLIRGDVSVFIDALETITDTNLIAAPQIRVLNKQRAELIIGDRISYRTLAFNGTQTVENVNFLDSGTRLILRPFMAPDGRVRLEIHPERSSATINPNTGLPNQKTTEVTTNVMARDGETVIIGGLIEEQVVESFDRIPLLGALPLVGPAFRSKTEQIDRTELIVLLTPRIVRDEEDAVEGSSVRFENERRSEHFRDHLAPVNRRNLARLHYEQAQHHLQRQSYVRARHHVEEALRLNKNDLKAQRLKDEIESTTHDYHRSWLPWPRRKSTISRKVPPAPDAPGTWSSTPQPLAPAAEIR